MHIAIITRRLPPEHCGIADHTVLMAQSLRNIGHRVTLVAGQGESNKDTIIIEDDWSRAGLDCLLKRLAHLEIDHLMLQYIPLGFLTKKRNVIFAISHYLALEKFWKTCGEKWKTSMIVHETYYRVWSYPPSLLKGTIQKILLKKLVRESRNVFTASQLLEKEMRAWGEPNKIIYMPLTSHFPFLSINRDKIRREKNIDKGELVLTLFGGGEALFQTISWVHELDRQLNNMNIKVKWLLLGGIPKNWLHLSLSVLSPGRLGLEEMSQWLQMTDIFLAPQSCGLAARRTTFLAALQHGLPIVSTKGYMTDPFLLELPGLKLTARKEEFINEIIFLAGNAADRVAMGEKNKRYYDDNFGWEKNVKVLSSVIT